VDFPPLFFFGKLFKILLNFFEVLFIIELWKRKEYVRDNSRYTYGGFCIPCDIFGKAETHMDVISIIRLICPLIKRIFSFYFMGRKAMEIL